MADNDPNNGPGPDSGAGMGEQPLDVEEMRYGRGPGEPEMRPPKTAGGHPRGLWVLFITEMWERFSYYGMRALLVLFLTTASAAHLLSEGSVEGNTGFGWSEEDAYLLYGVYTFMVYLTSIFGGIAADRFLGTHRSMLVGGWIIALGHITLALTALFEHEAGPAVSMATGPGALVTFMLGLTLIIIGTGFFKPCVSVMVGQLYGEGDARRDSGFTIFYMGINVGAFLAPLVAGTLGEKVGWHWGFGAAAVGMLFGLFFYQFLRPRYLTGVGDGPEVRWDGVALRKFLIVVGGLVAIPVVPLALYLGGGLGPVVAAWGAVTGPLGQYGTGAVIIAIILAAAVAFLMSQPGTDRGPLAVILLLAFFGNIFFWTAFEQAGSSLNIFAKQSTDRTIWGLVEGNGFPATWYQSVNPLTIVVFAPIFSYLWIWLDRRRLNPSTPLKFAIGLWLLGLAFGAMVLGSMQAQGDGLAGPHWLLITYVVVTWGELCLSPVGLSMVTKLAPARLQSLMMGLWFFSLALSNLLAGLVATLSVKLKEGDMTFVMEGLPGFFLMLMLFPIGAGFVILVMTPVLKRMMQGRG